MTAVEEGGCGRRQGRGVSLPSGEVGVVVVREGGCAAVRGSVVH